MRITQLNVYFSDANSRIYIITCSYGKNFLFDVFFYYTFIGDPREDSLIVMISKARLPGKMTINVIIDTFKESHHLLIQN